MGIRRQRRKAERRKAERQLEEALTSAVQTGQSLERAAILSAIAAGIFREETDEVARELESGGVRAALSHIAASATLAGWAAKWQVLKPLLGRIMEDAPLRTNQGTAPLATLGFNVRNPVMGRFLDEYTSKLSERLSDTSYEKFEGVLRQATRDGLSVSDASKLLRERMPEINANRARLIAKTELHNAGEGSGHELAKRSGVAGGKTWNHSGKADFRPEHKAQDGVTVGMDERFPDGSEHPSAPNCGCFLTFEINLEALQVGAA